MNTTGGTKRGSAGRRALFAVALIALSSAQVHADARRRLTRDATVAPTAPQTTVAAPIIPVQDQLEALYARIQGENDKILNTQGQIADALDRNANLLGVTIGVGVALMLLFGGILLAMRRATKASTAAARALSTLERAYVFLGKDVAVTLPDSPGPSAAVQFTFHTSVTNHGRTPAVIRWINLDHHYLGEVPTGEYEDHQRHGVGIVIGGGDTHALADNRLIIPRSEWARAEAGDGAIYVDGRIVYRDIFAAQHETYFCWRYDIPSRAFVVVESEGLNRYD